MTALVEGALFAPRAAPFSKENCVVTKKEIVKTISEEIGLTQLKTKEIVQKTFDAIVETLVDERRIELRNFGVFEVKKRAARKARNPRTGDKVYVPEKFVVTFKPGKEMEERVRELERQAAAVAERTRPSSDDLQAAVGPSPKRLAVRAITHKTARANGVCDRAGGKAASKVNLASARRTINCSLPAGFRSANTSASKLF